MTTALNVRTSPLASLTGLVCMALFAMSASAQEDFHTQDDSQEAETFMLEPEIESENDAPHFTSPSLPYEELEPANEIVPEELDVSEGMEIASLSPSRTPASIGDNEKESQGDASFLDRFSVSYYGFFYGPSVKNPSSYQPTLEGNADPTRPITVRNYLSLGYGLTEDISLSGTAYFSWIPVLGGRVDMEDPFLRLSHDSLFSTDKWNLYSDIRVHLPVTMASREMDMLSAVQTVQVLSYSGFGRLGLSLAGSARYNFFGSQGTGYDAELYIAPAAYYRVGPRLSFTLTYELGGNHVLGGAPFVLEADEADIEPGFSLDLTDTLNISPYLNIPTRNGISLASTSIEMMLTWFIY